MKNPLFIQTNIPHWLQPPKRDNNPPFAEQTWEKLLDWLRRGKTLSGFCRAHPSPDEGQLRRWIHADEARKAEYYEAQAIGAEVLEDEILEIADGNLQEGAIPNDTNRDALRVNTRKWLLGVKNRNRYGEKRQIDVGVSVDMGEVINEARERQIRLDARRQPALIENGEVVDG